jgi:TonB family protein
MRLIHSVLLAFLVGMALPLPLAAQHPAQSNIFKLPNDVDCSMPVYPETALKNHETGDVRLSINLNLDHTIKSIPFTSSGNSQLDDAAKAFISSCRFPEDLVGMSFVLAWTIEGQNGIASIKGQLSDIRKTPTSGNYQVHNYGAPPANYSPAPVTVATPAPPQDVQVAKFLSIREALLRDGQINLPDASRQLVLCDTDESDDPRDVEADRRG